MVKRRIVTVDVSKHLVFHSTIKYAILCDRTLEQIVAYAKANSNVYVFPFDTKRVEDVSDKSALMKRPLVDLYGDWIVQPMYIGNLRPIGDAIDVVIHAGFGQFFDDAECLYRR